MLHFPVLLEESLDFLIHKKNGKYVDCTYGRGGHTQSILNRIDADAQLTSFDKDLDAFNHASLIKNKNFNAIHNSFNKLENTFDKETVDGILYDLGTCSTHFDEGNRGFSFLHDGPLDMRFNVTKGVPLSAWLKKATQKEPDFSININHENIDGLSINNQDVKPLIKFDKNNHIGIHTNDPHFDFDVKGVIGIESKSGSFVVGEVEGDGTWKTIISNLDGINGFEVVASIKGKRESGRYALAHAIALSTFGGRSSHNKIKLTNSYYGSFFNRLQFRWFGEMHDYELQVRTRRHYGVSEIDSEIFKIKYNIGLIIF